MFQDPIYDVVDTSGDGNGGKKVLPSPNDYIVEISPKSGVLSPTSSQNVSVTFSARPEGRVNISVPIYIQGTDQSSRNSCIKLQANIIGPRLKVGCSEIDFGLVAVGGDKQCIVEFTNEGDVPMSWAAIHLEAMLNDDMNTTTNSNTSLNGSSVHNSKVNSFKPRGRSLSILSKSSSNILGSKASLDFTSKNDSPSSFKIDSPFCKLAFSPQQGTLGPRESGKVTINCSAGKLPQRLRATLGFLTADETKEVSER